MRRTILLIALVVLAAALEAAPSPRPIEVTASEGTSMSVAVSPDGRTLAIDLQGGIWTIAPDGSKQHKLTWGPFDDREPVWSHDGTRLAFASDRGNPLGSNYNIWVMDVATGACTQVTTDPAEDSMPTWSPDDQEIAFASTRDK